jgi:phosphodiesterase/alkaline phosphatase D-like protein
MAALAVAPAASGKAKGFSYGVSSGDVTSNSAILWAKSDKKGKTYLQVVSNGGFGGCSADNAEAKVKAVKDDDNTVSAKKIRIQLLDQNGNAVSDTGNRSMPGPPCASITIPKR